MLTADQVFKDFTSILPSQAIELQRLMASDSENSDEWTRWVKDCFERLGQQRGLEIRRTDSIRGESEFLFDLCWIRNSQDGYGMELVLECEWGEYLSDFRKLLHAKAPVKVLVFAWRRSEEKLAEIKNWIDRSQFKLPEEQYLIINLPDSCDVRDPVRLTFTGDIFSSQGHRRPLPETFVPLTGKAAAEFRRA